MAWKAIVRQRSLLDSDSGCVNKYLTPNNTLIQTKDHLNKVSSEPKYWQKLIQLLLSQKIFEGLWLGASLYFQNFNKKFDENQCLFN